MLTSLEKEMLKALMLISSNAAESAEWIRRVADEAIAKAEVIKAGKPGYIDAALNSLDTE